MMKYVQMRTREYVRTCMCCITGKRVREKRRLRPQWLGGVMTTLPRTLTRSIKDKSNISATLQLPSSLINNEGRSSVAKTIDQSLIDLASVLDEVVREKRE